MAKSKLTLDQVGPVLDACNAALAQAGTFGQRLKLRETMRALGVHAASAAASAAVLLSRWRCDNSHVALLK